MSKLTKAEFIAKWTAEFAPNNVGNITPSDFQNFAADIKDSFLTEVAGGDYVPKSAVKGALSQVVTDVPSMKLLYDLMQELGTEIGKGILSISVGTNKFHPEALTGNLEMPWHAGTHSTGGNDPLSPGDIGAEPAITSKKTAFNKDFGTTAATVMQGNDSRVTGALQKTEVLNQAGNATDKPLSQDYLTKQFAGIATAIQNISTVTNGLSAGSVLLAHLSQEVLNYIGTNGGGSGGTGARIERFVYTNSSTFALPTGYPTVDLVMLFNSGQTSPRVYFDAAFTRTGDNLTVTTSLLAGDIVAVFPVGATGGTGSGFTPTGTATQYIKGNGTYGNISDLGGGGDVTNKADKDLTINSPTASYTLALSDRAGLVRLNVASANTLTIPPNSAVAFPIGTQIIATQAGLGQTTIVPGSGVTINSAGNRLKFALQYSAVTCLKTATDTWLVLGDLVL